MSAIRTPRPTLVAALLAAAALAPAAGAQRALAVSGVVASAQHRVTGAGVERTSGLLYGAEGSLAVGGWVEVRVRGVGGGLSADSANAEDRDVAQGTVDVLVAPMPWVAFDVGAESRTFTTPLARQRWNAARIGAEGRLRFTDDRARGVLRLALLPSVSATGLPKPDLALSAGAGVEMERRRFTGGVLYEFERIDFPEAAGLRRYEQLSMLSARVGLRIGRR